MLRSYEIVLILKWHFCHIAKTVFDFDWTSTEKRYVTWNEITLDTWIFGRTSKKEICWRLEIARQLKWNHVMVQQIWEFFFCYGNSIIYAQTIFTEENLLSKFNKHSYILVVESPIAFTSLPWLDLSSWKFFFPSHFHEYSCKYGETLYTLFYLISFQDTITITSRFSLTPLFVCASKISLTLLLNFFLFSSFSPSSPSPSRTREAKERKARLDIFISPFVLMKIL